MSTWARGFSSRDPLPAPAPTPALSEPHPPPSLAPTSLLPVLSFSHFQNVLYRESETVQPMGTGFFHSLLGRPTQLVVCVQTSFLFTAGPCPGGGRGPRLSYPPRVRGTRGVSHWGHDGWSRYRCSRRGSYVTVNIISAIQLLGPRCWCSVCLAVALAAGGGAGGGQSGSWGRPGGCSCPGERRRWPGAGGGAGAEAGQGGGARDGGGGQGSVRNVCGVRGWMLGEGEVPGLVRLT